MSIMNNVHCNTKKKRTTPLHKARKMSLLANEISYRDLCQMFGCAIGTVYKAVHENGVGEKTQEVRAYIDGLLVPGLR